MFTLADCRILFSGGIAAIIVYHLVPDAYIIPALITLFITSVFYIYKRQKLKPQARHLGLTKNLKHARSSILDQSTSNNSFKHSSFNSQNNMEEGPLSSKRVLLNAHRRHEVSGLSRRETLGEASPNKTASNWPTTPFSFHYGNDNYTKNYQKINEVRPGITTFLKNTPLSREANFALNSSHSLWMKNASFSNSIGNFPSVHLTKRSPPLKTLHNDLAKSPVTIKIAPSNVLKTTKWVSMHTPTETESQPASPRVNACDSKTIVAAIKQNRKRLLREKDIDEPESGNITKRQRRDIATEAPIFPSLSEVSPKTSEHSKDLLPAENAPSLKRPLTPLTISSPTEGNESTKRACRSHLDVVLSYSSSKNLRASLASKRAKEPSISPTQPTPKKGNIAKSSASPTSQGHCSPLSSKVNSTAGVQPPPGTSGTGTWTTITPAGITSFTSPKSDNSSSPAAIIVTKPSTGYHPTLPLPSLPTQQVIPDHLSTIDEHKRDKQMENKRLNFLLAGVKEAFGIKEDVMSHSDPPTSLSLSTRTPISMLAAKTPSSFEITQTTVSISTRISSISTSSTSNIGEKQSLAQPLSVSAEKETSIVNSDAPTNTPNSSPPSTFDIPASSAPSVTNTVISEPEKTSQSTGFNFGVPSSSVPSTAMTTTNFSSPLSKDSLQFKAPNFNFGTSNTEQNSQAQLQPIFQETSNSVATITASPPSTATFLHGPSPTPSCMPQSSLIATTTLSSGFTFGLTTKAETNASTSTLTSSEFKFGDSTSICSGKETSTSAKPGGFTFGLRSSQASANGNVSFTSSVSTSSSSLSVTTPNFSFKPLGSPCRPETPGQVTTTAIIPNMLQQTLPPKFRSSSLPATAPTMTSPLSGFSAIASGTSTSSSFSPHTSIAPNMFRTPLKSHSVTTTQPNSLFTPSTTSSGSETPKSNTLFTFGSSTPLASTGSEVTSSAQPFSFGTPIVSTGNTFGVSTTTTQSIVFGSSSTTQSSTSSPFDLGTKSQPLFGSNPPTTSNSFNLSAQPQISNTFGNPSSQPLSFGASTQANVFGTVTSTTAQTPFGTTPSTQASNTFGTSAKSPVFGVANSPSPATFGAPSFQPTSFGLATTTQSSAFGVSSMQTQQQNAFSPLGTTSQPNIFSSQPATQSSMFSTNSVSQPSAFGAIGAGGSFGTPSTQANVFGAQLPTQTGMFGSTVSQTTPFGNDANKPTFGTSLSSPKSPIFSGGASTNTPTLFNSTQNQFGVTQNAFGSSFTPQPANNPFGGGSIQTTTSNQFETMATSQNPFGSPAASSAPSFGGTSLQNKPFHFNASTPANAAGGGFNFGASPANPPSVESAFKFNSPSSTQFNFGGPSPNLQQPFTFNANPATPQSQSLFSIGTSSRNERRAAHLGRRKTAKK